MKKFNLILTLLLSISFFACDPMEDNNDGRTGTVELNLKAIYDNTPVVFLEDFDYGSGGVPVQFSALQFYLSNIRLVDANGFETELSEIKLVNFDPSSNSQGGANAGVSLFFENVPIGDYQGLRFGLGVDTELNATTPSVYSSVHPLSITSNYWEPWNSYIFAKIEGQYDANNDGIFEGDILYHTGIDPQFRNKDFSDLEIEVLENQNTPLGINIDVKRIFGTDGDYFELGTETFTHTNPNEPDQLTISSEVMDNLRDAMQLP